MKKSKLALLLCCLMAVALVASACKSSPTSSSGDSDTKSGPPIIISSKEFTESVILGRLTYDYLDYLGYTVENQLGFGETAILRAAMASGEISMYWEYTNSVLMTYDIRDTPIYDGVECYDTVKAWDKENNDFVWMDMSNVNDTFAIVITDAVQKQYGITKVSELAELIRNGEQLRIAGGEEAWSRPDIYPRVQSVYEFTHPTNLLISLQMGMALEALKNGEAEINPGNSTDPKIAAYNLHVLEDDRQAFPPYHACITIRQDILDAYPGLAAELNKLTGYLDEEIVMKLIGEIDLDGKKDEDVSKAWLKSVDLIK